MAMVVLPFGCGAAKRQTFSYQSKPVLLLSTLTKVIISKAEEQGPVGDLWQRF